MQSVSEGKKLEISTENLKINTPTPKFKPFSLSKSFRTMGVLPKTPTYLKKYLSL